MEEIIELLLSYELVQSREEAEVWYITYNIPSFGKTAVEVVEQGHAKAILDYIERIYEGGHE